MTSSLAGLVALFSLSQAAAIESPRLRAFALDVEGGHAGAEAAFWTAMQGKAPLVEAIAGDDTESLVSYLWRGGQATQKIDMIGGVPTSNRAKAAWHRVTGTNVWFTSQRTPKTARFGYALRENSDNFQTDPLNPRICAGRSIVALEKAPPERWIAPRPDVPKGVLERRSIRSAILGEERAFGLFRPHAPGGEASGAGILLVFDGESYGTKDDSPVPTPTILDNLLHEKKTPPLVAVLLDSQKTRERDLLCSRPFNDFLTRELLPWVRQHTRASADPKLTVVAGSSYGGLAAACAAFFHPEVFGKVLSQSATLTYVPGWSQQATDYAVETGWLTRQFATTPRRRVGTRFFVSVGRYEGGPIYNLVRENRHLRDVLEAKGYPVHYNELVGAHDYLSWRNSLGEGLVTLFR